MPSRRLPGTVAVVPVSGVGEVTAGADLAVLMLEALGRAGIRVEAGDCLVVSSKVVSKALGLTWSGTRADAIAAGTVRVVAERRIEDPGDDEGDGDRTRVGGGHGGVTRVVESVAGPVMAAAGVDASNTGPSATLLVLPDDPDAVATQLRSALLARLGMERSTPLAVVLSDTAGRPWRVGLTDLAVGCAGLRVLEDLRGTTDHDGRALAVTMRAVADQVASAGDLVKGKADGIPAALVRGLDLAWFDEASDGARSLVRTGPGDWFALGHVEAVRESLGAGPGTPSAQQVGIASARGDEGFAARVTRVVALALLDVSDGSADVGIDDLGAGERVSSAEVTLAASDDYELGRLVSRFEVAAHSESLRATVLEHGERSVTLTLSPP